MRPTTDRGGSGGAGDGSGRMDAPDPLTRLPRRATLRGWLDEALRDTTGGSPVVLALLNVDRFARVNETLGMRAGDIVLQTLGERLGKAAERHGAWVARAGGDEFAVVMRTATDKDDAEWIVRRIVDAAIGAPVRVVGQPLHLTVTCGLAMPPPADTDELMRRATVTVRTVKRLGGDAVAWFRDQPRTPSSPDAVDALRAALADGRLAVHYQPIVDIVDNYVVAVEALARWTHPDGAVIEAARFMPQVVDDPLVDGLGWRVMRQACADAASLSVGSAAPSLSINVASRQLSTPGFADRVLATLAAAALSPRQLVIEVTETSLIDDLRPVQTALAALREQGVRVALDDFGTGYASLSSLRQLPIDILKIDGSFIRGLGRSEQDTAIVASVVSLARSIGLQAVAEAVETEQQATVLRALGCPHGQGYWWSRPVSAIELPDAFDAIHRNSSPSIKATLAAPGGTVANRRILEMHDEGASPQTIAAALNTAGLRTRTGGRWHASHVMKALTMLADRDDRAD